MGLLEGPHDRGEGRRAPLLLLVFLALTVGVINVSNWFVLSRVTASVDEELGHRLTTVASAAVQAATNELLLEPDVAEDPFVRSTLEDMAGRHDLENVFLVDTAGVVLFDLAGEGVGEPDPFLDLDFEAFTRATAGVPAASPSMDVGGHVLKAAYAPVEDWDGNVGAVLGVAAGAGFFARIPALRRTLLGVSAGSAALVIVLGIVFFGMSRRLTRAEAALARAETLSAMGMMAAGVAHEVRNPLAIIAGTADRLRKKYARAGEEEPLFDFIPEEVERLNEILEGYLRFARDEPFTFVDCDLSRLVERSVTLVEEEFVAKGIEVRRRGARAPLPVRADPQRIQQALLNLLLNAAQAMPEGGRLDVELSAETRRATIRVADTGPGFGERELRGAFQPFFTTKEKGSGLGLAMAKRIVEGHGGRIAVGNRPEGGAMVTVELPVTGAGTQGGSGEDERAADGRAGARRAPEVRPLRGPEET